MSKPEVSTTKKSAQSKKCRLLAKVTAGTVSREQAQAVIDQDPLLGEVLQPHELAQAAAGLRPGLGRTQGESTTKASAQSKKCRLLKSVREGTKSAMVAINALIDDVLLGTVLTESEVYVAAEQFKAQAAGYSIKVASDGQMMMAL